MSTVAEPTAARRSRLYNDIRQTMLRHLADPDLSVRDVSRQVHASPRHVQRVLSDHGTTFRDLLTELRMRRAAALLLRTDLTVEAIARQVGYRHGGHFAKAFRRLTGRGPREWQALRQAAEGSAAAA